jgi:zinc protease
MTDRPAPFRALRAALAAALALAAAAAAPALAAPPKTTFTLDNGLRAVVIEDRRAPVVTHMVWYRVGAADEPPGKSGVAHFLEHLMFKGTDEIPDGAFSKIVAANGGQDNAFTSRDYTGYFQRIAADRLDLMMKMEADRMRDLRFTETHALTERDVILEERNQRTENNPGALFSEARNAAHYLNHPYADPVIGWRHEIAALTRDDALDFYETYYAPNNAILVVAGDVTPEQVHRLAETHYGPIPANPDLPERVRPMEPPHRAAQRMTFEDPRVRQPYMVREYLAAPRRDGMAAAAARQVLADVLGDGINSRLQQALVVQQGVAVQAGAWFSDTGRDYGEFGVWAAARPGQDLAALEAAVDAALQDFLASDGPTQEELARLKTGYRASYVYAQDSQMALARRYGAGLAADLTLEQIEGWPAALQAVTAQDVMEAARETLEMERSITGYLRAPAPEAAAEAPRESSPEEQG